MRAGMTRSLQRCEISRRALGQASSGIPKVLLYMLSGAQDYRVSGHLSACQAPMPCSTSFHFFVLSATSLVPLSALLKQMSAILDMSACCLKLVCCCAGHIVTNVHVIEGASDVQVGLHLSLNDA